MKTKTEIRQQIKHLYDLKRRAKQTMRNEEYDTSLLKEPFQIIDYSILALKWAIDYKVKYKGFHYWCFRCHKMHPEPTCPVCGGNQVMELAK